MTEGSLSVSASAARKIKEILATEPDKRLLRVSVLGGGCSGFSYKFDLDDTTDADDIVLERDGATVVVDATSAQYMEGAVIDFVDELIGASFKVKNPMATASCGCGTSFAI